MGRSGQDRGMSATDINRGDWVPRSLHDLETERRNYRLAWLYGDIDARIKANAQDVEAWRNLGRNKLASPAAPPG